MRLRIIRAVLGVFNFRDAEIAELELAQQRDAENLVPLEEPITDTTPGGVLILRQLCGTRDDDNI